MKTEKILLTATVLNMVLVVSYVFSAYVPSVRNFSAHALSALSGPLVPEKLTAVQALPFASLDPHEYAASDQVALSLAYEPLMRFDGFLNVKPALAHGWYFEDETHFVVTLRESYFHSGERVTCDDVVASVKRAQAYAQSSLTDALSGIGVEARNSATCVFTLPDADYSFPRLLTRMLIVRATDAKLYAERPFEDMIGSGRYRILSQENKLLSFIPFEEYYLFKKDLPETILIRAEEHKYARLALVKNKEADILLDTPPEFIQQIETRFNYRVLPATTYQSLFIVHNQANPFLADADNRTLLSAMLQQSLSGFLANDASLAPLTQFAPAGVFGFASELVSDAARQKPAPFDEKRFLRLAFTEENRKLAQQLQSNLLDFNIELTLRNLSVDDMRTSMYKGDDDLFLVGWNFSLGTTDDFLAHFIAKQEQGRGGFTHLSGGTDARSAALDAALAITQEKKRLRALQDIMIDIARDNPIGTPLVGIKRFMSVRDGIDIVSNRMDGLLIFK